MMSKKKAKREITDISFGSDDSHIALVGPAVGGPANMKDFALLMKANANFSEETIAKAMKVRVEMELPEFLERFFGLYGSDGEVLARLMGWEPDEMDVEEEVSYWEKYIQDKVDSFTLLKSLHASKDIYDTASKMSEDEYLGVLKDQKMLEGIMKNITKSDDGQVEQHIITPEKVVDVEFASKTGGTRHKTTNGVIEKMTDKVEKNEEVVALQKALNEKEAALQKAQALVDKYEAEQKEAVLKAREIALKDAIGDDEAVTKLFKAVSALDDASFTDVVSVLTKLTKKADEDELFKEKGSAAPAVEETKVDALTQFLKSRYGKGE